MSQGRTNLHHALTMPARILPAHLKLLIGRAAAALRRRGTASTPTVPALDTGSALLRPTAPERRRRLWRIVNGHPFSLGHGAWGKNDRQKKGGAEPLPFHLHPQEASANQARFSLRRVSPRAVRASPTKARAPGSGTN